MMFATGCESFAQWTLYGEVTAGLRLQMPVVHFHLHDSHEFNLTGEFLDLFLFLFFDLVLISFSIIKASASLKLSP